MLRCGICGATRGIWYYDNGDLLDLTEDDLWESDTFCPAHAPEGWTQRDQWM